MRYCFFLAFCFNFCWGQSPYPQDYFRSPLDIQLVLSGTFAELRSNHFHSGMDIKTLGEQGLKVRASADGYVSRIKISRFGYGKALYVTHPNGYTTVYAHLQKFSPEIEAFVKNQQYQKEQFEIELFPSAETLKVEKSQLIAFSGNTGGSSGPHLHFEIRDQKERPMNPMLFGIHAKDQYKPAVFEVFAYPLSESAHINSTANRTKIRLQKQSDGNYKTEKIGAHGEIGFGIVSTDRLDLAPNKNGVSHIETFINGKRLLEVDFKRFAFNETKHINRYIDYEAFSASKKRIQKLFIEPNNPLSLIKNHLNKGIVNIEDQTHSIFKINIKDFEGNQTEVSIPIEGTYMDLEPQNFKNQHLTYVNANESKSIDFNSFDIEIPKQTFYEDVYLDIENSNDTLKLHRPDIPLQKSITLKYDLSKYKGSDREQLYIGSVSKYGKLYYTSTKKRGDVMIAHTKRLGTYTIGRDDENPKIKASNFRDEQWMSRFHFLKIKISDKISGIRNYRATVNGKWILMEYDYKNNLLTHDFGDGVITDVKNNLKVIVTDNVGNSSTFETVFYRKP